MKSGLVLVFFCLVMSVADWRHWPVLMQRHSGLAAFLTRIPNSPLTLSQPMTFQRTDSESSTPLCFCHPTDCRSSCCCERTSSSSESQPVPEISGVTHTRRRNDVAWPVQVKLALGCTRLGRRKTSQTALCRILEGLLDFVVGENS